jgi:hypothetical protein
VLSHARTSRNSTPYKLTVLDDEIVCLDDSGKPQFRNLLFHRGNQCFFPFDLLTLDGKDWRTEPLADRKEQFFSRLHLRVSAIEDFQLRRLMKKAEPPFRALRRGSANVDRHHARCHAARLFPQLACSNSAQAITQECHPGTGSLWRSRSNTSGGV